MMNMNGNNYDDHDQYTDYSCSTSLERLARDVETILRSWHVNDSDRHVSITTTTADTAVNNNSGNNNSGIKRSSNKNGSSMLVSLRSQSLEWEIGFHSHQQRRISHTVTLVLQLWDTHTTWNNSNSNSTSSSTATTTTTTTAFASPPSSAKTDDNLTSPSAAAVALQQHQPLPFSLTSTNNNNHKNFGLDNFLDLFGIGQHFTLTPVDNENASLTSIPMDLMQVLLQCTRCHDDEQQLLHLLSSSSSSSTSTTTTTTTAMKDSEWHSRYSAVQLIRNVLSSWLQTALNLAATNSQCAIPVFGLWAGAYGGNKEKQHQQHYQTTQFASPDTTIGLHYGTRHPPWMKCDKDELEWIQKCILVLATGSSTTTGGSSQKLRRLRRQILARSGGGGHSSSTTKLMRTPSSSRTFWSPLVSGALLSDHAHASFSCQWLPTGGRRNNRNSHNFIWKWGDLLLAWGPCDRAAWMAARHVYEWHHSSSSSSSYTHYHSSSSRQQQQPSSAENHPNDNNNSNHNNNNHDDHYRDPTTAAARWRPPLATTQVLQILQHAAGCNDWDNPLWGPPVTMDPIESLSAELVWRNNNNDDNNTSNENDDNNDIKNNKSNDDPEYNNHDHPHDSSRKKKKKKKKRSTLTTADSADTSEHSAASSCSVSAPASLVEFPLKIRSKMFDQSDWMELQMTLTSTLLNPTQGDMQLRTKYNLNIPTTSMTATLRLCCAVLIRSATLPPETLVSHLCDPELVLNWDNTAGNAVAHALAQRGGVSHATMALVAAMDWETTASEVISEEEAQQLVRDILLNTETLDEDHHHSRNSSPSSSSPSASPQFLHSSPPGRLVSILGAHLTSLRSLCSMAIVWSSFCQELRELVQPWRSLSNLHDGSGSEQNNNDGSLNSNNVASTSPNATGSASPSSLLTPPVTMGAKSLHAGQLHSSEPNPESHCLIQQKLQVLNICVECQNAREHHELLAQEQRILQQQQQTDGTEYVSTASASWDDDEFFDTTEIVDDGHKPLQRKQQHRKQQSRHETESSQVQRKGARCPVQGVMLQKTNTQLYAPYLQRPLPLTDDIVAERRLMMARQRQAHVTIRLEIARRLQEPKLLSDMQAFQAANPGATLQDFLSWYGNPKNPMEEYMNDDSANCGASMVNGVDLEEASTTSSIGSKSSFRVRSITLGRNQSHQRQTTRQKLDKAAEAIRALEDTREFWLRAWNKAEPIPAVEQPPLFDAANTVERVFDYMETLHPASLLCQVMAVNFCTSFYILTMSSGETANIEIVRQTFGYLRAKVENALKLLCENVISAVSGEEEEQEEDDEDGGVSSSVLSVATIAACERACAAFAETEVLLSRSMSLLNKYPRRYELVERILKNATIDVSHPEDRMAVLNLVEDQQRGVVPPGDCPEACIQDYLLQSMDSPIPCQLMVRYTSERDADGMQDGSLTLALAKCTRE